MAATDTERLAVLIEANTRSYERAMARIEGRTNQAMGRASRSVKALDTQMKAAAVTASRFMALFGVTLGIGGITKLLKEMDDLAKAAKRTGVEVESLQAFIRGAKLAGSSEEVLTRGFERMNEAIGQAVAKGGELADLLKANNISMKEFGDLVPKEQFLILSDLIANAAKQSERARIAQIAFGRGGREMIPYLEQGAAAIREQEQAFRDAGAIINADLIQAAERFNDAWTDAWLMFRGNAFNAISAVVTQLQGLRDAINDILRPTPESRLQGLLNRGIPRDVAERLMSGGSTPLEATVHSPRGPATVVPRKAEKAAKVEIDREREALERLLESHRLELAVLRELDPIQKEMIGHRETLSVATEDERQELENLIRTMRDLEEAQMLAAERMQAFQQAAFGALDGLIIRGQKATDVMRDLLTQIARMALHSAIFGGGLFGGGGIGSVFPKLALGGPVTAGRPYMVGERGPELFIPKASGQIVANDNIGGVTVAPVYQIDARGSDISENRFRAILEQNNQQLRSQVVPMIREAQSRRVL